LGEEFTKEAMLKNAAAPSLDLRFYAPNLVVLFEVHAGVHAGDLVAVAVEHLRWDVVREQAGVDAALPGL
jgi:hypothetical protein